MTNAQTTAETTLNQLGGTNKLAAMIGAENFSFNDVHGNGESVETSFYFKASKVANLCQIRYDVAIDNYTVELFKFSKKTYSVKKVYSTWGVEGSQLIELFEKETGLYLSL